MYVWQGIVSWENGKLMNTPQSGCMLEAKSGDEKVDDIRASGRIVE